MHKTLSKLVPVSCAILVAGLPTMVQATNGELAHAYGARQSGIAGSGVAFPQDPLIGAINPAGVVWVGRKNEIDIQWFITTAGVYGKPQH